MFRKHHSFKNNIITPLCIVEDRYNGVYSDGRYLAFHLTSHEVSCLPIDAGDCECNDFWEGRHPDYDVNDYIIGKGNTPEEAYEDLTQKLDIAVETQRKNAMIKYLRDGFPLDEFHFIDGNNASERKI